MVTGDYARSKAGTGEFDYAGGYGGVVFLPSWEYVKGWLAESFQVPQNDVWVLNIRKGVHWALDPASEASRLVNGREMTADDVKSSLEIMRDTPNSRTVVAQPGLIKNMTVEKTGPWQVTVRTPVDPGVGYCWLMGGGGVQYIWPKEWLERYGKTNEWRNVVGTGPYMVSDVVSGSVLTLKRNPNYWQKDPVAPGKGNQLPYPDGVKLFTIPDLSTRLATMRTGKGDMVEDILREDAQSLFSSRPSLQSIKHLSSYAIVVAMRLDKEDLPYSKLKVRQALMMATDFEAIKRDIYVGEADILAIPVDSRIKDIYKPLEELPASVQSLYKYNPEGAKQLLAEAGYPGGFKAKMVVKSVTRDLDLAAVVEAMWAKVGVDLEIQPRETSVFQSLARSRLYEETFLESGFVQHSPFATRYSSSAYRGTGSRSYVNDPPGKDPVMEKLFQTMTANFPLNPAKGDQALREKIPYILEQAFYIPLPTPFIYRIWQPWVKGYYGEGSLAGTAEAWAAHPWVDQDLKEQMTGRR
ncbi:MAG: ABC transporter substrate-binding protein [Chloroflexi bacterium]|nr:ABC transporter substrate-binding protein [Chloroflexota bacterium]